MSKSSKKDLFETIIFSILAICAYVVVFMNIDKLNSFYLSKSVFPALCLLATVVGIAFLYGTAVSLILSTFGLESKDKEAAK